MKTGHLNWSAQLRAKQLAMARRITSRAQERARKRIADTSLAGIAKEMGVSRSHVYFLLTAEAISLKSLCLLAIAAKVEPEDLLGGDSCCD